MRYTAFRAVCGALCMILISSVAHAGSTSIRFDQLEEYARSKSAGARIIELEMEQVLAERDKDLEWSNPEFAYDREDVGQAEEYQITLGKKFEVPWASLKKRSAWKKRMISADLKRQQQRVQLMVELKSGYVNLKLLDEYLDRLGQLKHIITDASHVATSRHAEGHLSGVEDHLVQMTIISLHAGYQSVFQGRREAEARWRAIMGFQSADNILLATKIEYRSAYLLPVDEYLKKSNNQPGYQAQLLLSESLGKFAAAERGKFIPAINLYGGFKRINLEADGYVAGLSISLPLFNRNSASARRFEIEQRIVASEAEVYRAEMFGRVGALVESIKRSQLTLSTVSGHFSEDMEAMDNMLYSYEEGWMTLSELLSAIQIEVNGLRDYYDQLIQYYRNIFELEAITATSLVTFTE